MATGTWAVSLYLLRQGDARFRTPVSLALLAATLVISAADGVLTLRRLLS